MEWRIRESGHGGYVAEKGIAVDHDVPSPDGIGFIMPTFIVHESARFDTEKQAKQYVKRKAFV